MPAAFGSEKTKKWHISQLLCISLIMYFYRFARKKQSERIKVIAALCFVCIFLFAVEENWQGFLFGKEFIRIGCQKLISYCLPAFDYLEKSTTEGSPQERILYYFFPVLAQGKKVVSYQTQVESELSYEMILAMEASDENYVDEVTGEVIGDVSEKELSPEVPQASQKEADSPADDGQLPAAAAVSGKSEKAVTYSREKLSDFDYLTQNFYRVDKTTTITSAQLNASEMLKKDMRLTHDAQSPQILIYHTHSQEGYADSAAGDSSTTVVGVGEYLTKLLRENYGLNVIHHTGEYDVENRDKAYSSAGPALEQLLLENPSIEVVIDLHRDGVGENTRLVTSSDGVEMAKIMFVNGLSRTTSVGDIAYLYNPNLSENLAFSFQIQLMASEYYPGLSRGVYLKGYRYNLHYCPKSLLVEVGAQTNTVQEAMNAMVPLADILNKVVTGEGAE